MSFLEWAALIVGGGLIASGARAVWQRRASVPERIDGGRAVALGWLWISLGALFVIGVAYDVGVLKTLFKLFLEAAN